jgi:flavin reductase (DIM6/NTAB) family NADH-FMN oxidoreductase RutF
MPVSLIGTTVEEKANFMVCAWINRINFKPPIWGLGINKKHATYSAIEKNQMFSINFPSIDLLEKVDYCGLTSGKRIDKSDLFNVFYGDLQVPMIVECPLTMECKVLKIVDLPTNPLILADVINAFTEEEYLTDGKPDIKKMKTFVLTMPDNIYWSIGESIGKAWGAGKKLKKKTDEA